jgi:hypothetical protein
MPYPSMLVVDEIIKESGFLCVCLEKTSEFGIPHYASLKTPISPLIHLISTNSPGCDKTRV